MKIDIIADDRQPRDVVDVVQFAGTRVQPTDTGYLVTATHRRVGRIDLGTSGGRTHHEQTD